MTNDRVCLGRIVDTVSRIHYPGLEIRMENRGHGLCLFVAEPNGVCAKTGMPMSWEGRRWPIELSDTVGAVVQTALKAVLTYVEHEVRERFTFQGETVFDPHQNFELVRGAPCHTSVREIG
ncbi:hypothetical protein Luutsna6_00003 [Pseudomonas phage vB_PpuP-Luutsna-6]